MTNFRFPAQRGFSIVSAIFLLVVIAALGTFAVTLSTTQHQTSTMDLQGARAYQAARAGIEWGVFQVLRNPTGINCGVSPATASNTVAMPAAASTLTPFSVSVQCMQFAAVVEGNDGPVTMFQLTSTASAGPGVGSANYVERQITMTIAN